MENLCYKCVTWETNYQPAKLHIISDLLQSQFCSTQLYTNQGATKKEKLDHIYSSCKKLDHKTLEFHATAK